MPFSSVLGASSVIKPGVCTSSTRPTVPYTGQLIYETDTGMVAAWNGSAWVYTHSSGLVLVKTQTIGTAVSSVTVSDVFSSTYDNYKITIVGGVGSWSDAAISIQMGSTTSGYYFSLIYAALGSGSPTNAGSANAANWLYCGNSDTNTINLNCDILGPNLAKKTILTSNYVRSITSGIGGTFNGFLNDTTQYTTFTLSPSSGTLTGGTIRVYGMTN
jgi:hypothetical protein